MNLWCDTKRAWAGMVDTIFPRNCGVCGCRLLYGEHTLCLQCMADMPRTHLHLSDWNLIHERLATPGVAIHKAAAMFYYFRENPYARLIQVAKYDNQPSVARSLARVYARELMKDGFFDDIDLLLPMPLHWLKKARRGYNQTEEICRALSAVTGIAIADNLRVKSHKTQTRKNPYERMANVSGIMSVIHPEELAGKHLLLVDDVITTGATMLSAAKCLINNINGVKVSVLTLGCTKLR